ncbi:MAG: transposase [Lachnospiraceae bacterium]|nr:transposase [Lachnospiraceae bacterium]
MSRTARIIGTSGIYHVMMRGINRQPIFTDARDRSRFLEILKDCREVSNYELYAYCLMNNHLHLLIRANSEPLSALVKRIGTRYAVWYNKLHDRSGHLFQDRFKSKPVDNDSYFLTVLHYILYNPVKDGLCANAAEYYWSSARDYFYGGGITDTSFAEKLLSRPELIDFLSRPCDSSCLDDTPKRVTDRQAVQIIRSITGLQPQDFARLEDAQLKAVIPILCEKGISTRQLSRLSGMSIGILRKY